MSDYYSQVYGDGVIIARLPGEIVVRFDNPPGMVQTSKAHIVPVVHIAIQEREE